MDRLRGGAVGSLRSTGIDQERLLEKILQARPWATARDVVRLAPAFAGVPEKELEARMTRIRRRQASRGGGR